MKVRMPQPRRKRSMAPKETRAHRGSYWPDVSQAVLTNFETNRESNWQALTVVGGRTYKRDDLLLHQRRERDELEDQGEVQLDTVSFSELQVKDLRMIRTDDTKRAKEMVC